MMPRSLAALVALGSLMSAGCATIVDGKTANVTLQSVPSEANVTVRDHEGGRRRRDPHARRRVAKAGP